MMSKHSPAPWIVHQGGQSEYYIKSGGWVIAETCKPYGTDSELANARLIAMAPNMLRMLILCRHQLSACGATDSELYDLDQLIANTRG